MHTCKSRMCAITLVWFSRWMANGDGHWHMSNEVKHFTLCSHAKTDTHTHSNHRRMQQTKVTAIIKLHEPFIEAWGIAARTEANRENREILCSRWVCVCVCPKCGRKQNNCTHWLTRYWSITTSANIRMEHAQSMVIVTVKITLKSDWICAKLLFLV